MADVQVQSSDTNVVSEDLPSSPPMIPHAGSGIIEESQLALGISPVGNLIVSSPSTSMPVTPAKPRTNYVINETQMDVDRDDIQSRESQTDFAQITDSHEPTAGVQPQLTLQNPLPLPPTNTSSHNNSVGPSTNMVNESTARNESQPMTENKDFDDNQIQNEHQAGHLAVHSGPHENISPTERGRGRPRKSDPSSLKAAIAMPTVEASKTRPQRNAKPSPALETTNNANEPSSGETKRGRGRPRKLEAALASQKRKRTDSSPGPGAGNLAASKRQKTIEGTTQQRESPRKSAANSMHPNKDSAAKLMKKRPTPGLRFAFSGSSVPCRSAVMQFLVDQGGEEVTALSFNSYDCILVGKGELVRSYKVLLTVALGKPILSDEWLKDSAAAGTILDKTPYEPNAPDFRRKRVLCDDIRQDLEPRSSLLRHRMLFVTPSLRREYGTEYSNVETLANVLGAKGIFCKPYRSIRAQASIGDIILGSRKSDIDAVGLIEHGLKVFGKDMLSASILRGVVELSEDEFELENPPPKKTKLAKKPIHVENSKASKPAVKDQGKAEQSSSTASRGRPKKSK